MSKKVLTISVAAYNTEPYIEKAINSIIESGKIEDIQVIIELNASKDKTAEVIKPYLQQYPDSIIAIDVEQNGGYGLTINKSIENATGKYLRLLDGDDWYNSAELAAFVDEIKSIDTDMILCPFTYVYEETNTEEAVSFTYESRTPLPVSDISRYFMHALTVSSDVLKKNNVRITENCFYTDVEFFIKSMEASDTFIYLPQNVYMYRLGRAGQSVSLTSYLKHIDEHETVTKNVLEITKNNSTFQNMSKHIDAIALRHINLLLCLDPSDKNQDSFKKFCQYMRTTRPDIYQKVKGYTKLAAIFPDLLYKPVCKLRRRKNDIR